MRVNLLNGVNALKTKDNATVIELEVLNDDLSIIDLTQYSEIVVNIGKDRVCYQSIIPILYNENKALRFTVDGNLPNGKHVIEINLIKEDGTIHIAPSRGKLMLTVESSLEELGEKVTLISVRELLEEMNEVLRLSNISNANSAEAVNTSNKSFEQSTEALALANDAKETSLNTRDRTERVEELVDDVISKTRDRILVLCFPYMNLGINNLYGRFPFKGTIESVRGICSKFGSDVFTEIDIEKSSDMEVWESLFDNSFLTFNPSENFDNGTHILKLTEVQADDIFRLNVRTLSQEIEGVVVEIKVKLY